MAGTISNQGPAVRAGSRRVIRRQARTPAALVRYRARLRRGQMIPPGVLRHETERLFGPAGRQQ